METRKQGLALLTAVCLFIGVLVIIQLWLVAASLDALLSGETQVLIPAAVASAALFALNGGLVLLIRNFDRRLSRTQ